MSWDAVDRAIARKRQRYAALKKARTCACGAWMDRAGEYHYQCPKCGTKKLRK